MLIFDFIKDGVVYKGLEYHRGMNEVFNPVRRWAEGHGDNTKHFAYEAISDMLNDELEEIRAKVEEQAMFEKINKGLGIQK
jgi:molybdopterin synthase catalytic subunit